MNPKHTLYWILLAAAMFGYILLFEWRRPDGQEQSLSAIQLFPGLNSAGVERIEIVRSNQTILAERREGEWRLVNPTYPAQSQLIEQWLSRLQEATRRASLAAGEVQAEPSGAAAFGLNPPAASVSLHQPPHRFEFLLGARTAVGEKAYLQFAGTNEVVVTDAVVLDGLPDTVSDWRDPRFVDLSRLAFNRFAVTADEREFEMEFMPETRRWRMTRPRVARVNEGRFIQALQQLQALRVEEFVQDQPGVDLEPYGLHEPALVVEFASGTNLAFGAQFGQSPDNQPDLVYARRSDYPNVVTVSRQVFDAFGVPYRDFLDYRLVDVPLDQALRIEIQADESFTLERQPNSPWLVTAPHSFRADPALVQSFLSRVSALSIVEVAKEVVTDLDLPNYGLSEPPLSLRFFGPPPATNDPPALLVGLAFGTNRDDRTFVRRSDENPVYTVKSEELQLFPQAAFQLRDRRIWNFSTNEVMGVTVHRQNRTDVLVRSQTHQWSVAPGSQGIVNTFALEEAVHRLGTLWARAWVAQGTARLDEYGIPQLDHWVEIELRGSGEPRKLRVAFGATSPSGGPFAAVEFEEGPVVFEFPLEIYYVYEDVIESLNPL
jgi:hypothetical protein